MPRDTIDLPYRVEYLAILDEKGEMDAELAPDLADETLLKMHRVMLLARRFDERLLSLQRQGQIGTFAPVKGQEAAQIGAMAALEAQDWMVPSFRETAAALWRGTPLSGLLLYNAGYNEGGRIPDEQNDLPIAIPVASQIPHAVGIGYGMKLRQHPQVVITFFGDGATSEGDFHESLNFASVFQCPVIFLCQNNQWAISIPREQQSKSKTLAQKALAYGVPGIQVDGNDALAVYAATREAADRARAGDGPTLIECLTYRLSVHTTADDPSRYRSEEEVESWRRRDPIERLQILLKQRELLDDAAIESLENDIKQDIDTAWKDTKQQIEKLRDPSVMFEHLYAESPSYLQEQQAAFSHYLQFAKGVGNNG
jgi:pyruvate dehydrogenase E1 component alpha subunit